MSLLNTKDTTYNGQKIGYYQGADFAFFSDVAISADVLQNFFKSMMTATAQYVSGTVMSNSLFTVAYGYHMFSAATGYSKLSMKLPVPSEGMVLALDFGQFAGDANISIFASTGGGVTGVSVVRPTGSALSTILVSAAGFLKLLCESDGAWTVIEANASVTQQPSA